MFDIRRDTLRRHSVDMRQFADCRESTLPDGQRVLDVCNAVGLAITLLPDRGLDIWTARIGGTPLTWISRGSPHRADSGSSWLQQFNGGLLVTCGLQHSGPSEVDDETGEVRDVHGRYSRLPADVQVREGRWEDDRFMIEIAGTVSQSRLFGEQLVLRRTIRVPLDDAVIELEDVVSNEGDVACPFMLLYHWNFGYPLVRKGSWLDVAAVETRPRDDAAREGVDTWPMYEGAVPGFEEQVFYHHVLTRDGEAAALLGHDELAVLLRWETAHAPYFTQWKNAREGMYVSGLEPGNCVPEGLNAARRAGRLIILEPGEVQSFRSHLAVFDGTDAVAEGRKVVESVRDGVPAEAFAWPV